MFIEIHMIQNFAPSNLNRDDTNNPKDCEFGGARRARISSQCIKRSIREHPIFTATTEVPTGTRTRYMTRLLVKKLTDVGKDEEIAQKVAEGFSAQYAKMDKKKKDRSSVLIYLSEGEISLITQGLLENWDEVDKAEDPAKNDAVITLAKEIVKSTKNRTGAPDIALFGRMLAEKPELNLDAACQVSHAISTHRVNMEMDFYTAVDDLLQEEETGAGMMGVTGFNSACFYRYARIDWQQLVDNLDGDIPLSRRTVEGFIRASAMAIPTGKQNAFAAQNPPDFLLAVVRKDGQSWSLANAFENPVYAGSGGLVPASLKAVDEYWGDLERVYGAGEKTTAAICLNQDSQFSNLETSMVKNLETCVEVVLQALPPE